MSRTTSPVIGKPYGLAVVCRAWGLARSTVYRHREPPRAALRQRPGPVGPMPDAELADAIRAVLAASPFHGEGHRKVWARLRFAGVRTSRRRVLRLMRENGLLAPSRTGPPPGPTHVPIDRGKAEEQGFGKIPRRPRPRGRGGGAGHLGVTSDAGRHAPGTVATAAADSDDPSLCHVARHSGRSSRSKQHRASASRVSDGRETSCGRCRQ